MKSPLNKLSLQSHAEFSCRHCSHYVPEGRRGGTCELLGVGVQSQWAACGQILPVLSGTESVPISHPASHSSSHSGSHSANGSSLVNTSSSVNASESSAPLSSTPLPSTEEQYAIAQPSLRNRPGNTVR